MASISIDATDRVFVLTGAGISAESGLPTFRAEDGLWAGYRVEDVCTPEAWQRNPAGVWAFYSARRDAGQKAKPNPAHIALAELEAQLESREGAAIFSARRMSTTCTSAPARAISSTCTASWPNRAASASAAVRPLKTPPSTRASTRSAAAPAADACARTSFSSARFRSRCPASSARSANATLMLVVGTSGSVYPAANFVHWARQAGARTVYIGPERPLNASAFTHIVEGKAGQVLPGLFQVES